MNNFRDTTPAILELSHKLEDGNARAKTDIQRLQLELEFCQSQAASLVTASENRRYKRSLVIGFVLGTLTTAALAMVVAVW